MTLRIRADKRLPQKNKLNIGALLAVDLSLEVSYSLIVSSEVYVSLEFSFPLFVIWDCGIKPVRED